MAAPILVMLAGTAFRVLSNPKTLKTIKKAGAKIIKEKDLPKTATGRLKKVGDTSDFNKLIKRRTPTIPEKIGNLFVPKNKRVRLDSPGDVDRKRGIVVGKIRTKGKERGDIVKGVGGAAAAGGGGIGAAAIAKSKSKPKTTTVKSGDTLSQIAKDKNTTLAAIKKANPNITNLNKIKPGQVIKLR